jgi:pimeloyl-ACP methyl ester carboxylesterase
MLKKYFHKRERYYAMLNDNRVVRPFGWGTEFVDVSANSDEYFFSPEISDFKLDSESSHPYEGGVDAALGGRGGSLFPRRLTWTSAVETPSIENNTAYATWFPHETNKSAAVIVLPHWNARAGTYFDLCKVFNRVGLSALRLTMPYHEERMPPELERADHLVAPNVGRTIQSMRQAVVDTRACVRWLKEQGYERVGIVGTSIGSATAFLAFVHDAEIDAAVFNHVSGYMADVVWHGLSTYHVREGLGENITLDELREYWLPVSPMAYMQRLAELPERPQRYIYTRYDLSFPLDLSLDTMDALVRHNIAHSEVTIPCGHYTLGEKPWVYYDGYKIVSYLRKHLK